MTNFAELLKTKVSDAKAPPTIPPGTYTCQVETYETGESNQKKTPYIRFKLKLLSPEADVDFSETEGGAEAILGRSVNDTYYLTEDALFRLRDFFEKCGLEMDDSRELGEYLPEVQGQVVLASIINKPSPQNPERMYTEIASLTKAG